jgi:hypothetical protein
MTAKQKEMVWRYMANLDFSQTPPQMGDLSEIKIFTNHC